MQNRRVNAMEDLDVEMLEKGREEKSPNVLEAGEESRNKGEKTNSEPKMNVLMVKNEKEEVHACIDEHI